MKVIINKIWTEPAVAIGLLVSIILAIIAIIDGSDWDVQTILGIAAPFASSLGIRQTVRSNLAPKEPV
jgi:hypothetical protein